MSLSKRHLSRRPSEPRGTVVGTQAHGQRCIRGSEEAHMLAFVLDPYGMEDAVDRIVAEAGGGHVQRKVPARLVGGGLRPQFDVAAKERVVRFGSPAIPEAVDRVLPGSKLPF